MNYLPSLVLNLHSPDLCFQLARITGVSHRHPAEGDSLSLGPFLSLLPSYHEVSSSAPLYPLHHDALPHHRLTAMGEIMSQNKSSLPKLFSQAFCHSKEKIITVLPNLHESCSEHWARPIL
jgi:hypothetical protein